MSVTLHIFNPSHDEALASGSPFFTPSQVALQMEEELSDFPRLWTTEGDVCRSDLFSWLGVKRIEPWGWDARIRRMLRKDGAPDDLLPDDKMLEQIRSLSSRRTVTRLLPQLVASCEGTLGESFFFTSEAQLYAWLDEQGEVILKAPWSCSGRGVFRSSALPAPSLRSRIGRIIAEQGGIEAEPYYAGGHDFAMEFRCIDGEAHYLGASVFLTSAGGQYRGNIVDSEENLMQRLEAMSPDASRTRYIYNNVRRELTALLSLHIAPLYDGPVGVDMLLVGERIHPMLEINLRQTMGSVAIRLRKKVAVPSLLSIVRLDGRWTAQLKNYAAENALIQK